MKVQMNEFITSVADMGDHFLVATENTQLPVAKQSGLSVKAGDGLRYTIDIQRQTVESGVSFWRDNKQYATANLKL